MRVHYTNQKSSLPLFMTQDYELKIDEFTHAMNRYFKHWFYKRFEMVVATLVIFLQLFTLSQAMHHFNSNVYQLIFALVLAYAATDFVNGLVHMYMDNNTSYTSFWGPFIAAFHLHHAQYTFTVRHPLLIYFFESRTKFWLLIYLILLVTVQFYFHLNSAVNIGLVAFGLFSSFAELSHYWCHHSKERSLFIQWLQKKQILLSVEHHQAHHREDNIQYAFLNGMTDGLINPIAKWWSKGYKKHADRHARAYLKQM